jgi:hypothetical protein
MRDAIAGACLCGAVTFEVAPPYRWFAHCHCSMCRKHHGTLFGTTVGVARTRFRWLSGAADVVHYRASPAFPRPFCRHCGSKLPSASHDAGTLTVPVGLLAGDVGARPRSHIFVGSKSRLCEITDSLARHDAYPPGLALPPVAQEVAPSWDHEVSGSCLCRAVEFAVDAAPIGIVNCHCSLCRKSRGSAFATTLLAAPESFRWLSGEDRVASYALAAPSRHRTDFCADCGSPAPTLTPDSAWVLLPAGAIDRTPAPLPVVHIYVASKASWDEISDSWPQFDELPTAERFTELFLQAPR